VQLLAKTLVFPFTHRIASRFGLERMLVVAVGLIALVAWMWGGSASLSTLVLAQFLSGIAWAFYEFVSFQLLLRHAKPSHRVEFLAVAASLGGIMQLTGAMLGSWLLTRMGFSYRGVFLVSAVARCLPLFLFLPMLYEKQPAGVPTAPSLHPAPLPGE
jgi:MFS family permease